MGRGYLQPHLEEQLPSAPEGLLALLRDISGSRFLVSGLFLTELEIGASLFRVCFRSRVS